MEEVLSHHWWPPPSLEERGSHWGMRHSLSLSLLSWLGTALLCRKGKIRSGLFLAGGSHSLILWSDYRLLQLAPQRYHLLLNQLLGRSRELLSAFTHWNNALSRGRKVDSTELQPWAKALASLLDPHKRAEMNVWARASGSYRPLPMARLLGSQPRPYALPLQEKTYAELTYYAQRREEAIPYDRFQQEKRNWTRVINRQIEELQKLQREGLQKDPAQQRRFLFYLALTSSLCGGFVFWYLKRKGHLQLKIPSYMLHKA